MTVVVHCSQSHARSAAKKIHTMRSSAVPADENSQATKKAASKLFHLVACHARKRSVKLLRQEPCRLDQGPQYVGTYITN